jgi:hypothetical protein
MQTPTIILHHQASSSRHRNPRPTAHTLPRNPTLQHGQPRTLPPRKPPRRAHRPMTRTRTNHTPRRLGMKTRRRRTPRRTRSPLPTLTRRRPRRTPWPSRDPRLSSRRQNPRRASFGGGRDPRRPPSSRRFRTFECRAFGTFEGACAFLRDGADALLRFGA